MLTGAGIYQALPLWVLLSSLLAALLVFLAGEDRNRLRITVNLAAAVLKLLLVGVMGYGVLQGHTFLVTMPILPGLDLVLHADALTMLFTTLSALLWLVTTIYAIAYLERRPNRARFFGFFSLCVASTMGIATAGNLFTFFIFYELLTLATWPLVVHNGWPKAMAVGRMYLRYTLGGGVVLLLGIVWLAALGQSGDFVAGGTLEHLAPEHRTALIAIFLLLIGGLGVKAALVPLHGWLPSAMVAPAPVSALLHAVAVVKAGAFGVVRVVYDVFGTSLVADLQMNTVLALLASFTIIYGSVRAIAQTDLKRRLAYSTVSQVSYITLGVALGSPLATIGGLVHLVHQGLMKITLFFCAGNYAENSGIHSIDELNGIGRRMPWTTAMFTIGAFGMMGAPPLAGFVSKWYLGMGALQAGAPWVLLVLLGSTVLNAIYFLPLLHRAWFRESGEKAIATAGEPGPGLLVPTLLTGISALGVGILAGFPLSPLSWVTFIVGQEYAP
ncbi:MAG: monovalent cation/H+ antiporter subunit D family protein [Ectothiorhodospiraceae bacterium]|nr:monovalent cation/H+ antiporter subunit D family protein [Ectothiorhodospiraceae bacterium]MCH8504741.1 monovalent cation/H+ antiporter subunit D family protein [Ectothiorhodospiraceae bacterium]